jgi:pilus assembly protein CpaC
VRLVPVGDKLLVTGQARDAAEAAQIMVLIRGEAVDAQGQWARGRIVEGTTTGAVTPDETGRTFPASQVINMLRIPGVHQVALRVKIAELNRTAARGFGVDLNMLMEWADGAIVIQSLLNAAQGKSILGTFDQNRLNFGIRYLEQAGVIRMLSEPTLVTLSGRPASFVAGGEFAVPTVVGVQGASGISTDFRAFGAIVTFLPTVIDKDHIRLQVSPEFSKVNAALSSGGTPGLDTRTVTTTVEMREGQTLAIAGLLDESMKSDTQGDLPLLAQIFGSRNVSREETELIILVTPELVHPMDPEEVPPLPGFDVTEPNNTQFFLQGWIEGRPTEEYRSTVWPRLRDRYNSCGSAMISGPYGHGNCGN